MTLSSKSIGTLTQIGRRCQIETCICSSGMVFAASIFSYQQPQLVQAHVDSQVKPMNTAQSRCSPKLARQTFDKCTGITPLLRIQEDPSSSMPVQGRCPWRACLPEVCLDVDGACGGSSVPHRRQCTRMEELHRPARHHNAMIPHSAWNSHQCPLALPCHGIDGQT